MFKKIVVALSAYLMAAASTIAIQHYQLRPDEPPKITEDVLYFPDPKMSRHFSGGLGSVVADFAWIQTINFASRNFEEADLKHRWMDHMFHAITDMDPYYVDAYRYGGLLSGAFGRSEDAIFLLRKGFVDNPYSIEIAFELAQSYLLNLRGEPYAKPLVIHYLTLCAERSETPEFFFNWIEHVRRSENLDADARQAWLMVIESSTDNVIRDLAEEKLALLDAELLVEYFDGVRSEFVSTKGQSPTSFGEILRAASALPVDLGDHLGEFYLSPDDTVRNTRLDADLINKHRELRQGILDKHQSESGSPAASMAEAFESDFDPEEHHPVPGHAWVYDPETGTISDSIVDPRVPAPYTDDDE